LNINRISDRQIEVHRAERLVPDPFHLEIEITTAKFKKYKSPGSDTIPAGAKHYGLRSIN
jgi:hypothetical protein